MKHPSALSRKRMPRETDTAMKSSAKYCCPARQGEFRSGARSCHFFKRALFIQRHTVLTLFGVSRNTEDRCHWPIAEINQHRRLDQMHFLPQGAATCGAALHGLLTLHSEPHSRTGITTGESDRVSTRALKFMTRADVASIPRAIPPCLASSAVVGTREE